MKARDIMTHDVVTIHPRASVREAVALMTQRGVTSLPVVDDDNSIIGIISEVDILRDRMPHDPSAHLRPQRDERGDPAPIVRDVMTDTVICLSENADTADLAELFVDNKVRAIPIIRGADLVGIVSRRDVLRTLLRDDTAIRADVAERLDAYSGEIDRWHVEVENGVVTVRGHFDDERQERVVSALAQGVNGAVRVHVRAGHWPR
jgi:CBS domain-containing protein